jgi:DNA-binding response OmpR family regulator
LVGFERKRGNDSRVLIVEDDAVILNTLAYNLTRQGFGVQKAISGAEALKLARQLRPDLILLDVMLPGESGIRVCEKIREEDREVVIVMVTAKDAEEDKVQGFEAGADDYVTKPFGMKELVARINANLKRSTDSPGARGRILEAGDLWLDTKNYTARVKGEALNLRLKEFELLVALASQPGELKSREELPRRCGDTRAWAPRAPSTSTSGASGPRSRTATTSTYTPPGVSATASSRVPRARTLVCRRSGDGGDARVARCWSSTERTAPSRSTP